MRFSLPAAYKKRNRLNSEKNKSINYNHENEYWIQGFDSTSSQYTASQKSNKHHKPENILGIKAYKLPACPAG